MKVRTSYDLEEKLDQDIVWRRKEFTTLKFMVQGSQQRSHEKEILIRASITLLYAHWEGHVKHCAQVYLNYLSHQGLTYSQINDNFFQLSFGKKFSQGFSIKKFSAQKALYDYITTPPTENFFVKAEETIDTESNLKYEVVFNILEQLGLDSSIYVLKKNFIDEKLLKCRNEIAHGDRTTTEKLESTYLELEQELLNMIMEFHNRIKNAVSTKSYLKTA